jgi:predicted nuclease with TOPRIM domain
LIDEIDKLRNENREKMKKLEATNYMEQTALTDLINNCKKEVLDLKSRNHELEMTVSDVAAQAKLKNDLMREELNMAK